VTGICPKLVIASHSRSKNGVASLAYGDEAIQRAPAGALQNALSSPLERDEFKLAPIGATLSGSSSRKRGPIPSEPVVPGRKGHWLPEHHKRHGVWVPAFAGTTVRVVVALNQPDPITL
jgi:hypothetical protein